MTEGTRAHIADIIVALDDQRDEIERLVGEAMQEYSMAMEKMIQERRWWQSEKWRATRKHTQC